MKLSHSFLLTAALAMAATSALAQPPGNALVPGGLAPLAPKAVPGGRIAASVNASSVPLPADRATLGGASDGTVAPKPGYDYVLGSGDKLRIVVFGEENLSGEFTVAGNGEVSFPLIGSVKAAGQPVSALCVEIQTALKEGYLKDPKVSAEVLTFRPYFMLGEVGKPGEYPYSDGLTVLNAVAAAGGFTYRANHKFVFLKRAAEAASRKVPLTEGLQLSPGDTVRVAERLF